MTTAAAGESGFPAASALKPAVYGAQRESAIGLAEVSFADPTALLCDDRQCVAMRDGLIVYRDDNHLTGRFASATAAFLGSGH